jgi:hypothetical protein
MQTEFEIAPVCLTKSRVIIQLVPESCSGKEVIIWAFLKVRVVPNGASRRKTGGSRRKVRANKESGVQDLCRGVGAVRNYGTHQRIAGYYTRLRHIDFYPS